MVRKIIHSIYRMLHSFMGCTTICILCAILSTPTLKFLKFIGCNDFFTTSIWFGGYMIIFFFIAKIGAKIEHEKNLFSQWRNIIISNTEPINKRERSAWKMLNSKELTEKSLHEIVNRFNPSTPINDAALDKLVKINKSILLDKAKQKIHT